MGERVKITKTTVDKLQPGQTQWDADCIGFHVRRQRSKAKTYAVFYRTKDGRQRFCKIGRHGSPWTVDEARAKAREILVEVNKGHDPAGDKCADRETPTVAELCDRYFADAKAGSLLTKGGMAKKASTLATDRARIETHIKGILGRLKVAAVTSDDVERFRDAVVKGGSGRARGGKGTASRTMGLLGAIFTFAIRRKLRSDNPVRGVQRFASVPRDRRVTDEEYARLGEALRTLDAWPPAIAAVRFLCLTGWRSGEALGLKWSEVDLAARTAHLGDTKTGRSMRPLSNAACDVIRQSPRMSGDLVFPSARGDKPMTGAKAWAAIARRAGLPADVTPHTLRHSFASVAHDLGYSELTIAALIGHKKASITSRYVHAADSVLLQAADAVARSIEERMGFAAPDSVVVELPRRSA
jgi:integrase